MGLLDAVDVNTCLSGTKIEELFENLIYKEIHLSHIFRNDILYLFWRGRQMEKVTSTQVLFSFEE